MKPTPKAEIVIETFPNSRVLSLHTASADANAWVEKHAPEFGLLEASVIRDKKYLLSVSPVYSISEVAAYIRTMGTDVQTDLSAFSTDTAAAPTGDDGTTEEGSR